MIIGFLLSLLVAVAVARKLVSDAPARITPVIAH